MFLRTSMLHEFRVKGNKDVFTLVRLSINSCDVPDSTLIVSQSEQQRLESPIYMNPYFLTTKGGHRPGRGLL